MKTIYEIKVSFNNVEKSLFFDTQERAEKLVAFIKTMLTDKGNNLIEFSANEHSLFDSDEDISSAFVQAMNDSNKPG